MPILKKMYFKFNIKTDPLLSLCTSCKDLVKELPSVVMLLEEIN